jgi:hypothetical protein
MKIALQRGMRASLAAIALACLGACTTMIQTPPGTPVSQVEAKYGQPD